ncbi:hypothetical protein LEP1GSC038_4147 [Leptospira weilii str. 2006001855]|uniref:Uncharacterized protein n=1 Tax=Leptospira weilii str. 2006001855 TaxID=996804 RepID=M6FML3_9LEPT|nr:hypothetical protein LEP1GSC051_2449 [Leptospira sp. P2653]EMM71374.1 hypothetical protein LEP1GSC038_4147 [Leptospira weilii str. 2006001855]
MVMILFEIIIGTFLNELTENFFRLVIRIDLYFLDFFIKIP